MKILIPKQSIRQRIGTKDLKKKIFSILLECVWKKHYLSSLPSNGYVNFVHPFIKSFNHKNFSNTDCV